jgi:hypothetical protein
VIWKVDAKEKEKKNYLGIDTSIYNICMYITYICPAVSGPAT